MTFGQEVLDNGIQLPAQWPPRDIDLLSRDPLPVPYLQSPPEVIPVNKGRQLLFDDFLIGNSSLELEFHLPTKFSKNPVFFPEVGAELRPGLEAAVPKDGGIWWIEEEGLYRMWYEAGWLGRMAVATSCDGLHWERSNIKGKPGSNLIIPELIPDSTTVTYDPFTSDASQRFKLYLRQPGPTAPGFSLVSADGIHWSKPIAGGLVGDRTTAFYNPFRNRWVYSCRSYVSMDGSFHRTRLYREHEDFLLGADWTREEIYPWMRTDFLDLPDPDIGVTPQLYNINAVAYESIMLGMFEIHYGPNNQVCAQSRTPKITELQIAFSRDGFHFDRPDRRAFIQASRKADSWDRGYVQPVGGICIVKEDELWFYYSAFQGNPNGPTNDDLYNGMYGKGSTGLATLRRDGFASRNAPSKGGSLTTRPLSTVHPNLFINADAQNGELVIDLLDLEGHPLPGRSSRPIKSNGTKIAVNWQSTPPPPIPNSPFRIRFQGHNFKLFSFWFSPSPQGHSLGYLAAGSPGAHKLQDLP